MSAIMMNNTQLSNKNCNQSNVVGPDLEKLPFTENMSDSNYFAFENEESEV